jgi:hypothetical protein
MLFAESVRYCLGKNCQLILPTGSFIYVGCVGMCLGVEFRVFSR